MEDRGCELSATFTLFHPLIRDVTQVREKAIDSLNRWVESISPKEAVIIAKQYGVQRWLRAAYIRLLDCSLEGFADSGLDWETIARLLWAKQTMLVSQLRSNDLCLCGSKILNGEVLDCICLGRKQAAVQIEFQKDFESMMAAMHTGF